MTDLPDQWSAYARLQEKLADRSEVDDYSWGLEAGLNRLLTADLPGVQGLERAAQSESRKERYHARLRRIHLNVESSAEGPENALDDRRRLHLVKNLLAPDEWWFLLSIGEGYDYNEIAAALKTTSGALRVRLLRLRSALAHADPPKSRDSSRTRPSRIARAGRLRR
jgi:hypothetical protein